MFDPTQCGPFALEAEAEAEAEAASILGPAGALKSAVSSAPPTSKPRGAAELLQYLPATAGDPSRLPTGLAAMRLLELSTPDSGHRRARVKDRSGTREFEVSIADEVELTLLERALLEQQFVLVEFQPGQVPVVLGLVQARLPQQVHWRGEDLTLEGSRSVTLTSGRAGLKLHADGHVELIGTRVSAVSRGLMRLIGRALRLN